MNLKRKFLLTAVSLLIVSITVLLCSCFLFKHIEDTNGEEDYSLCTITDERICSKSTSIVEFNARYSDLIDQVKYSAKKFSGVKNLYSFTANANKAYAFMVTTERTAGNLRICVVNNGSIVQDVEIGYNEQIVITGIQGTCYIRAAGESAECLIIIDF